MAIETVPVAAELTPVALLHELTRWMESAQYGADHPWRVAITKTLAEHDADCHAAPQPGASLDLAWSALWEITSLSILMRDYIAKNDIHGTIEPVTRGMLARVQQLSEVVDECIGRDKDSTPLEELAQTVECRRPAMPSTTVPATTGVGAAAGGPASVAEPTLQDARLPAEVVHD